MTFKTLTEVMETRKNEENKGITFISSENNQRFLSYKELYFNALSLLYTLQNRGIKPKDEVIFQIDDNQTFVTVFWACLLGGIIPVPITPGNTNEHFSKVFRIRERLKNPYLIISQKNFENLADFAGREKLEKSFQTMRKTVIFLEDMEYSNSKGEVRYPYESDIAFIQFSSGSTTQPKGVTLTHKNLLTNIRAIIKKMLSREKEETLLSWMPLTHDMGIIGFHLLPVTAGWNHCLMPASLFIRRPMLWLKKASQQKATITSSPNFGYKHFLKFFNPEKCEGMDLSSLRLIFNGAEPISAELCNEFLDKMAPYGLKRTSMFTVYGLAEASLAVAFPDPGGEVVPVHVDRNSLGPGQKIIEKYSKADDAVTFVQVGTALDDCQIKIADDQMCGLGDRVIGRILVKGDNVTSGYYRDKDTTSAIMTLDGWLDTGDLGFTRDGQLVITGRAKDIIFANGQNYYAHDLEWLAEKAAGVDSNKIAAAGVFNHRLQEDEILFFITYRKKDLSEFVHLANTLKKHINEQTSLTIHHIIPVKSIPKTTSGKVQRYKLTKAYTNGEYGEVLEEIQRQFRLQIHRIASDRDHKKEKTGRKKILASILERLYQVLGYIVTDLDRGLFDMGIESIKVPQLQKSLEDTFHLDLPVSLALDYPTVNKMTDYLYERLNPAENKKNENNVYVKKESIHKKEPIAIIGMGCRFPGGADNPDKFWENLAGGVCSIEKIPVERWDMDAYDESGTVMKEKIDTLYGGFLTDIDRFDAAFFKITPREACLMDPQQRLVLEVCREALENSGLNISKLEGSRTGVFLGISSSEYADLCRAAGSEHAENYTLTGSLPSIASGRISYLFGFQGPTLSIDTACSSSLVAVHQAVRDLRTGACDLALAGGVNLILTPRGHISLSGFNVLAADGRCKTFDASTDGYGRSEGCGMVVLKPLSQARRDNDRVLALITGSAVNHDGRSSGLTVPNGLAQQRVIREALTDAGISPGDIDYVETHGTGTKLGDPQEVDALAHVFAEGRSKTHKLLIGSVKTNIGHLESAAGIAGLIKVVLALQKEVIPKHLHFNTPNPSIPWDNIPVSVTGQPVQWPKSRGPRIAGVSSFGFSGTNSHVLLQEAPGPSRGSAAPGRSFHILTLSANDFQALRQMAEQYMEYLSQTHDTTEDICYTSNISRSLLEKRMAVVGCSKQDLAHEITKHLKIADIEQSQVRQHPMVMFLFSGQGTQYVNMGRELYETSPLFKRELDRCDSLFSNYIDQSLTRWLYWQGANEEALLQTVYSQPLIFSIQYALLKLWESYGIKPVLVFGHSIGQYAAAYCAGVFSLEDAVKLAATRGKLMQSLPRDGAMAAVTTDVENIRSIIQDYDDISIAAINGKKNITISGKKESLQEIQDKLESEEVRFRWLKVSHAFHSPLMKPVLDPFRETAASITYREPRIPIITGIPGKDTDKQAICQPAYWVSHISEPVHFCHALEFAEKEGCRIFVEIGATVSLSALAADCIYHDNAVIVPSLSKKKGNWEQLLLSIAQLYLNGVHIDWEHFHQHSRYHKVSLPTYPFQRHHYWIDAGRPVTKKTEVTGEKEPVPTGKTPVKKDEAGTGIRPGIKDIISSVSGLDPDKISGNSSLFSLGLDSLMIAQLRKKIKKSYDVEITVDQFFHQLSTADRIAQFLELQLPTGSETPAVEFERKEEKQEEIPIKRPPPKTGFRSTKFARDDLNSRQKQFIKTFAKQYSQRTRKSRVYRQKNQRPFSHWLHSLNFRISLKELQYPLLADHARGAYFWDADGNKYIDLAMGYGVHYFGHCPGFILEAIEAQAKKGFVLSPHQGLPAETARLICQLTGVERVTFCNTGSEAVMFALRLARTVSKRNKILCFAGSYHGIYDGVLAEADDYGTFPSAPGIMPGSVEDIIVLPYGTPDSLEKTRKLGPGLAAVLVEPVQSRRPGFQPKEFLQELRKITSETGTALIFDEMITGFRIHPGGAQHYFGIKTDIVTYGKIVGGGLPIGILAGKPEYLDAVDGGPWNFNDSSVPESGTTFIAGTFANHPLSIAAAHAALSHIKTRGPALQEAVNERTRFLAAQLNCFFQEQQVPIRIKHFGPVFRFESFGEYDLSLFPIEMDLFFYLLMAMGIYTWEQRICFLSTAHTDEDIQQVIAAVKESIKKLRAGGFSFSTKSAARAVAPGAGHFAVTPAQKAYYILDQMKDPEKAVHFLLPIIITGKPGMEKIESAIKQLVKRHEALRTGFEMKDGEIVQVIHDSVELTISYQQTTMDQLDTFIVSWLRPFDLVKPPLLRACIAELQPDRFLFVLDAHQIIADGFTANIIIREFMKLYRQEELTPVEWGYNDGVTRWHNYLTSASFKRDQAFWQKTFPGELPRIDLPVDFPRSAKHHYQGAVLRTRIGREQTQALKELAKMSDSTLFLVLLACHYILLHQLTGQEDIIIGVPISIRGDTIPEECVGFFTNNLGIRAYPARDKDFRDFLTELRHHWVQAYMHKDYPYEILTESIEARKDPHRNPLFDVMFIYENGSDRVLKLPDLDCQLYPFDMKISLFDSTLEVIQQEGSLEINLYYRTHLFKKETAAKWVNYYQKIAAEILNNPGIHIKDILKEVKIEKPTVSPVSPAETAAEDRSKLEPVVQSLPVKKTEKQLLEIWKKELNFQQVGINDDFFQLGGRSLDTLRLISAINTRMGTRLPLTAVFAYPTVAELARVIEEEPGETKVTAPGEIPTAPPGPDYPLSYNQVRYWTGAAFGPGWEVTGTEITGDILVFSGPLDIKRLQQAVNETAKRHPIIRTTYRQKHGAPVQIIHQQVSIPAAYFDLTALPPGQRDDHLHHLMREEHQKTFNLKTGPLMRFTIYKTGETRYILYCNAAHISFDAWSYTIILHDLAHFYNSPTAGETLQKLPPVRQYVDYVQWNRARIKNGELDHQARYWSKYLEENIPVVRLPSDYEPGTRDVEPPRVLTLHLDPESIEKLRCLAAQENTTPFVTMMAVLKTWMAVLTNENIITIGTVFTGRTYPGLEKIAGIMMNTLPVRLNLSGNPGCREILARTKQAVLDTFRHQDYPLEEVTPKMRKALDFKRDIYSTVFIGQEAFEDTVNFNGLNVDFHPLVDFIGKKQDKNDTFSQIDYQFPGDLLIEMVEKRSRITLLIRYNHRRFRSSTIKEYFHRFEALLKQFLDPANFRLSHLQPPEEDLVDELFS